MNNLKKDINELRESICLKEDYWEFDFSTNCYAFALGLDVPEDTIVYNAYQPGVIGATFKNLSFSKLKRMSIEDRILLDLAVLNIKCKEVSPNELSGYYFNWDRNYNISWWVISLFLSNDDFHFMRKSYDGIWWQKNGYFAQPNNIDLDESIITNPKKCNMGEYKYVKSYKLQYIEKYNRII